MTSQRPSAPIAVGAGRPRARQQPVSGAPLVAAIAIVVVALVNIEVPYYAITPGPAIDVVGLIAIEDEPTERVNGELLLTTVSLHPIRIGEAVRGWFDPSYEILSRSAIIPPGESDEQAEERSNAQMLESHEHAAAAALTLLGYDVKITPRGTRVIQVDASSPAREVLRRGDVIVKAETAAVQRADDLKAVIKRRGVGEPIELTVQRGDSTVTVTTEIIASPDGRAEPVIGVFLEEVPVVELPVAIRIDSLNIGGPSAGLMYALGIVDLLDDRDLASARRIAGTGEITVDGLVGAVGGVEQKVASARNQGAEMFLVPANELQQACDVAGEMPVFAVGTLTEAVRVLRDAAFAAQRDCR